MRRPRRGRARGRERHYVNRSSCFSESAKRRDAAPAKAPPRPRLAKHSPRRLAARLASAAAIKSFLGRRGITIVDDGTLANRRGSLSMDDEGNPSNRTVLIEDGILRGYIQDTLNARLMKMPITGNARRESYAHIPMPRMTNTYMLNGTAAPEEIIKSVKRGLYAANFAGGQVDITSGKFVFSAAEAYMIEDGKITYPVKGATLIGNEIGRASCRERVSSPV